MVSLLSALCLPTFHPDILISCQNFFVHKVLKHRDFARHPAGAGQVFERSRPGGRGEISK